MDIIKIINISPKALLNETRGNFNVLSIFYDWLLRCRSKSPVGIIFCRNPPTVQIYIFGRPFGLIDFNFYIVCWWFLVKCERPIHIHRMSQSISMHKERNKTGIFDFYLTLNSKYGQCPVICYGNVLRWNLIRMYYWEVWEFP